MPSWMAAEALEHGGSPCSARGVHSTKDGCFRPVSTSSRKPHQVCL